MMGTLVLKGLNIWNIHYALGRFFNFIAYSFQELFLDSEILMIFENILFWDKDCLISEMKVIEKWVHTKHSLNSCILFFFLLEITQVRYRSEYKNDYLEQEQFFY